MKKAAAAETAMRRFLYGSPNRDAVSSLSPQNQPIHNNSQQQTTTGSDSARPSATTGTRKLTLAAIEAAVDDQRRNYLSLRADPEACVTCFEPLRLAEAE